MMHLSKNYYGNKEAQNCKKLFYKENIIILHEANKFNFEWERVTQLPFGCNSQQ